MYNFLTSPQQVMRAAADLKSFFTASANPNADVEKSVIKKQNDSRKEQAESVPTDKETLQSLESDIAQLHAQLKKQEEQKVKLMRKKVEAMQLEKLRLRELLKRNEISDEEDVHIGGRGGGRRKPKVLENFEY